MLGREINQEFRDITDAYYNTQLRFFDDAGSSKRQLKTQAITDYFAANWIVSDKSAESPFWRIDKEYNHIDVVDLAVFMITGKSPKRSTIETRYDAWTDTRPWYVDLDACDNKGIKLQIKELSESEGLELLKSVVAAGHRWTIEEGRLHPGLSSMLQFVNAILESCENNDTAQAKLYVKETNKLFSYLANNITDFDNPDCDDANTMLAVGAAYEKMWEFLLVLPPSYKQLSDMPFGEAEKKITSWANEIKLGPWRRPHIPVSEIMQTLYPIDRPAPQ